MEMKSHTVYRTFNTQQRRELIRITEDVQAAVDEAGIAEGLALVAAMHITAAVWINDDEPGLHEDGRLDLGPWQQVFYCEFDGRRRKRMIIKVLGE
jgi:thiamine phosphate synthase YjbQ (UPF0047 family)